MISPIYVAALLGAITPVISTDPYENTETVVSQEVGTTTIDGHLVYSMNYCTVVHNTMCQVSLSTDGYISPTYSGAPGYSAPETQTYASAPTSYGEPGSATTEQLTPTATHGGGGGSTPSGEVTTGPSSTEETSTGAPPDSATPTGSGAMATAVAGNVVVALAAALFI